MPIVKVGDQRIKFPDEMSQEEIALVLQKQFPSAEPANDQPVGISDALGAGLRRGAEEVTGGFGQRAFEGLVSINERRLADFANKLNSGEIEPTEEALQKYDQLSSMVMEGRRALQGAEQRESQRRAEFSQVEEQRPILSTIGRAGGQIGGGLMLTPGITSAAPATLKGRAALGAITGGALGGIQPTIEDESVGKNIAVGAAAGGLAPPVIEKAVAPAISSSFGLVTSKLFGKPTPAQKAILKELQENPRNPDFAKFEVVQGRPKKTAALKEAVAQFGDPATIAVIKSSNQSDRQAIKKMVEIIQKGKKDPLFMDRFRVGDVVGDSLKARIVETKNLLESSGKEIDNIVKTKLQGKTVDVSNAKAQFKDALDQLRVGYDPDSGAVTFTGSALEGVKGGQARDLVKRMALRLKKDEISAEDAHFAKRLIDQETSFGTSDNGLSGEIERAIKGLRFNLNQSLRDEFPDYAKANQKYSDAIDVINSFQDSAGSKLDLDNVAALGTKARSFTNNTQARANLLDSLEKMQSNLEKYGIKFDDDILLQANVANALENRFKTQGSTAFKSEITKGVSDVVTEGAQQTLLKRGGRFIEETLSGVSDEKALESLLKILGD